MDASVVIPFFNAQSTLARAIDSVLAQEGVNLEILLIDNNSVDKSSGIALNYANQHDNISIHQESQQGANSARNLGLQLAQNEWIQYLDADDELLPQKILNQLSISSIDKVDVISSPITELSNEGKIIKYQVSDMNDLWLSILHGKIGWTCSNLWRKSSLVDVGGWNIDYTSHQEKELMTRLIIENKKFYFYNESECIVHEQPSSVSKRTDFPLTGVKLMKYLSHYLESNNLLTLEREKAIQNQLYHKLLMAYKINAKEARNVMNATLLDLKKIELPLRHKFLISVFGINKAFGILKALS